MGASRAAMRKMAKDRFWEQDDEQEDIALRKIAKDLARTETYKSYLNWYMNPAGGLLPCGHHTHDLIDLHGSYCECNNCPDLCVPCNQIVDWSA